MTLFNDLKELAAELDARRKRELDSVGFAGDPTPLDAIGARLRSAELRIARHPNCNCDKCKVARQDWFAAREDELRLIAEAPVDAALLDEMRATAAADDAHRETVNARDRRRGFCSPDRAGEAFEEGFRQWETYGVKVR